MQSLLEHVIGIAGQAAERILQVYRTPFEVESKRDASPVTEADMQAHHCIVDALSDLTPGWPVLSEESAHIPYSQRRKWKRYWLVDPLDGTREFVKRNDEFTVNIALIEHHRPILGVIQAPVSGVCYYARRGAGAFKRNASGQVLRIAARSCPEQVVVAGSRSLENGPLRAFLAQLDDYRLISKGSSLKSCLVAEGRADIYPRIGPTSEWDTAAAQIIVAEAGGRLMDLYGEELRYNTKDSLLNPNFLVVGDMRVDWPRYFEDIAS